MSRVSAYRIFRFIEHTPPFRLSWIRSAVVSCLSGVAYIIFRTCLLSRFSSIDVVEGVGYILAWFLVPSITSQFVVQHVIPHGYGKIHAARLSFIQCFLLGITALPGYVTLLESGDFLYKFLVFGNLLGYLFALLFLTLLSDRELGEVALAALTQPIVSVLLGLLLAEKATLFPVFMLGCFIVLFSVFSVYKVLDRLIARDINVSFKDLSRIVVASVLGYRYSIHIPNFGASINPYIGIISFKSRGEVRGAIVVPTIHAGPLPGMAGSQMPFMLFDAVFRKRKVIAAPLHGPCTHDQNPLSRAEVEKVIGFVLQNLEKGEYSSTCSRMFLVDDETKRLYLQRIGTGYLVVIEFRKGIPDIEYSLAEGVLTHLSHMGFKNVILVDAHTHHGGELKDFSMNVASSQEFAKDIAKALCEAGGSEEESLVVGMARDPIVDWTCDDGVGGAGIIVVTMKIDKQRICLVVFDANGIEPELRLKLVKGIEERMLIPVLFTTDTHSVHTPSGGLNPLGKRVNHEMVLERVLKLIDEAEGREEIVEASCISYKMENVRVYGLGVGDRISNAVDSAISAAKYAFPVTTAFCLALSLMLIFLL